MCPTHEHLAGFPVVIISLLTVICSFLLTFLLFSLYFKLFLKTQSRVIWYFGEAENACWIEKTGKFLKNSSLVRDGLVKLGNLSNSHMHKIYMWLLG